MAMQSFQWAPPDGWGTGPVMGTMPPQASNTPIISSSMLQGPLNQFSFPAPAIPPALKPDKPLPSRSSAPPQKTFVPEFAKGRERSSAPAPKDPYEGLGDASAPIYMPVDRYIEVPVEKVKLTEIPVLVDKLKFQDVPVQIEKLVIKEIPVPIDKIIEKVVTQEVDKTDYGLLARLREELKSLQEIYTREKSERERERAAPPPPVEIIKEVIKEVPVHVPVEKRVEVPVEKVVEKIVYVDSPSILPTVVAPTVVAPSSNHSYQRYNPRMIGIGLALERNAAGRTIVDRIIPGFAASLSDRFQIGDVVLAIDDVPVQDWALDAIKQLTVGEEGSVVRMELQRNSTNFSVTLRRVWPDFVDDSNSEAQHVLSNVRSPNSTKVHANWLN